MPAPLVNADLVYGRFVSENPSAGILATLISGVSTNLLSYDPTTSLAAFTGIVGSAGSPGFTFDAPLYLNKTLAVNAFEYTGLVMGFDVRTQSVNTAADSMGLRVRIGTSVANSFTIQALEGGAYLDHTAGSVHIAFGTLGSVIVNGAGGTTDKARAGNFGILVNAGTITEAVAVNAGVTIQGSGVIVNAYGIKVQDVAGATTGNFAIFTGRGHVQFGDQVTISDGTAALNGALMLAVACSTTTGTNGTTAASLSNIQTVANTHTVVGVIANAVATLTSGVIAQMEGLTGQITMSGAGGTVTAANAVQAGGNITDGTITQFNLLRASNPGLSGTGAVGTLVGLLIDNMTRGTVNFAIKSLGGRVSFASLPTSAAGLASGDLWNNSGVVNIV